MIPLASTLIFLILGSLLVWWYVQRHPRLFRRNDEKETEQKTSVSTSEAADTMFDKADELWKTTEGKFTEIFRLMHDLFGAGSEVREEYGPSGPVLLVRCRACHQKNRLKQGVEGASCASCHVPLSRYIIKCGKCGKRNRLKQGIENASCSACHTPFLRRSKSSESVDRTLN